MVSIFPPVAKGDRPTLIFTHKELNSLYARVGTRPNPRLILARKAFKRIRDISNIGGHIGWPCAEDHPVFKSEPSFILCNPEQAQVAPDHLTTILAPAAWLTPDSQNSWQEQKVWDFATVATTGRHKNWREALTTVRHLLSKNQGLRILLIATPTSYKAELEFRSLLTTLLYDIDISRVDIVSAAPQGSKGVLPNTLIRQLLALTKIFALFSTQEGTSKILIEASKEGCVTLANSQINHVASRRLPAEFPELDPIQFESNLGASAIEEALLAYSAEAGRKIREGNHRRYNFHERRRSLQADIEQTTGQRLALDQYTNLSLALPAHTSEEPVFRLQQRFKDRRTSDVLTATEWLSLYRYLQR